MTDLVEKEKNSKDYYKDIIYTNDEYKKYSIFTDIILCAICQNINGIEPCKCSQLCKLRGNGNTEARILIADYLGVMRTNQINMILETNWIKYPLIIESVSQIVTINKFNNMFNNLRKKGYSPKDAMIQAAEFIDMKSTYYNSRIAFGEISIANIKIIAEVIHPKLLKLQ